jgi:hypothetical protein
VKKQRLHPLDKPFFLESDNQKWCAVFTVIGLLVMVATSYGWLRDPTPFLTFFTGIGVTFILGASGSDIMKAYKVDSLNIAGAPGGDGDVFIPDPKDVDDPTVR